MPIHFYITKKLVANYASTAKLKVIYDTSKMEASILPGIFDYRSLKIVAAEPETSPTGRFALGNHKTVMQVRFSNFSNQNFW